jgi:hypothetical protein
VLVEAVEEAALPGAVAAERWALAKQVRETERALAPEQRGLGLELAQALGQPMDSAPAKASV